MRSSSERESLSLTHTHTHSHKLTHSHSHTHTLGRARDSRRRGPAEGARRLRNILGGRGLVFSLTQLTLEPYCFTHFHIRRPCTIHYTPYTTHHELYTIHHTPYTIHHTPYTKHHTPYTILHTPYTVEHISQSKPVSGLGWLQTTHRGCATPKRNIIGGRGLVLSYLPHNTFKVVWQKSIFPHIRQLILYCYSYKD